MSPVSHVSLAEQFDRLAPEASGLADRGVLCTDKFPEKQACVEKIEADEAATGDAWYDEEEEAMLRQEEGRAEGAVADEEEARTNANSSTAPSSSAAAGSDAASSTSAWLVHASVPAMSKWLALKIDYGTASQKDPRTKRASGRRWCNPDLSRHPSVVSCSDIKKKNTQHRTTNRFIFYSILRWKNFFDCTAPFWSARIICRNELQKSARAELFL